MKYSRELYENPSILSKSESDFEIPKRHWTSADLIKTKQTNSTHPHEHADILISNHFEEKGNRKRESIFNPNQNIKEHKEEKRKTRLKINYLAFWGRKSRFQQRIRLHSHVRRKKFEHPNCFKPVSLIIKPKKEEQVQPSTNEYLYIHIIYTHTYIYKSTNTEKLQFKLLIILRSTRIKYYAQVFE